MEDLEALLNGQLALGLYLVPEWSLPRILIPPEAILDVRPVTHQRPHLSNMNPRDK